MASFEFKGQINAFSPSFWLYAWIEQLCSYLFRLYGEKERIQIFLHFFVMVSLRFYHGRPTQVKRQVNLFYLEARYNLKQLQSNS